MDMGQTIQIHWPLPPVAIETWIAALDAASDKVTA
jgi:hypothetical protein